MVGIAGDQKEAFFASWFDPLAHEKLEIKHNQGGGLCVCKKKINNITYREATVESYVYESTLPSTTLTTVQPPMIPRWRASTHGHTHGQSKSLPISGRLAQRNRAT